MFAGDAELLSRHVIEQLSQGHRVGSRKPLEPRSRIVTTGTVAHALASATARIGESLAVCGVTGEFGPTDPDLPDEGRIDVSVTLSPLIHLARTNRDEASTVGRVVALFVQQCLEEAQVVDLAELCIRSGEVCWVLKVDVVLLHVDAPIRDLALCAANGALQAVRLPRVQLPDGEWTLEKTLAARSVASCITMGTVLGKHFIDMNAHEELTTDGSICVLFHQGAESGVRTVLSVDANLRMPLTARLLDEAIEEVTRIKF